MSPPSSEEERIAFLGATSYDGILGDDRIDEILLKKPTTYKRILQSSRSWLRSRPRAIRRNVLRHPLHALAVAVKDILILFIVLLVATPILAPSYTRLPPHYRELKARCEGPDAVPGCANPFREKVFISVSLYDKKGHLAGGRWGETMLELIQLLGPENTFLSIYENDTPGGEAALWELEKKVPCNHEIVYEPHVPLTDFANITMPDGNERMKRLSYLSEMRNRALRPLDRIREDGGDEQFDKVLFLNDIAFNAFDAAQLLFNTNLGADGRSHYLSVCGLDYNNPFLFYDLYAQRDAEGFSNGLPIFPIFSTAGQGLSRADMLAQKDAVRATACWSGIVAMQARYVQNLDASLPTPDFEAVGAHTIDPDSPAPVEAPVRFRYEPEIFVDACECCLFLADVSTAARKDHAAEQGVFVNPYVRVAYDESVLHWLPVVRRWERLFVIPQRIISYFAGLPRNNPYRTVQEGEPFVEERWNVAEGRWELVNRTGRSGLLCAVREMQLIQQKTRTGDKNWLNVQMPPGQRLDFPT
ncbi:hypothetical protein VPNG_07170 [Cytospora leucostoma]|uniref:Glycosyltransferase family 69 protein n=1 Tax=Cytospora leucostoma TaxID=1230097 RepID=A0A423WJU4_9PEZI|nr:hypothetical protein VPNG_07170 [Cytospora leucostoma]